ncbi:MAG: hypothetical protein AAGE76_08650 [Pseudomonadota bacterium]
MDDGNPETQLVLELRKMRADLADMRRRAESKDGRVLDRIEDLTVKLDGLASVVTLLAGHTARLRDRIEGMERG